MSIGLKIKSMPLPYYLNMSEKMAVGFAHVDTNDLKRGNKIINIGVHLEAYDDMLPTLMMLCEEGFERRIAHETIHIILYQEEGEITTVLFDKIDSAHEITQCGFKEINMEEWLNKYKFPIKTYDELVQYLKRTMDEHHKEIKENHLNLYI